jgi:hypothetical protein
MPILSPWVVLLFLFPSAHAGESWPGVPFASVRAFVWPADQHLASVVQPDLTPLPGAIDPKGALLSELQTGKLIAAATRRRPAGRLGLSSCFEPHHAFIFYDGAGRPVAFFEVCLHYHGYRLAPELPDLEPHYGDLASLCVELELPLSKDFSLGDYRRQFESTYIDGEGFEGAD